MADPLQRCRTQHGGLTSKALRPRTDNNTPSKAVVFAGMPVVWWLVSTGVANLPVEV